MYQSDRLHGLARIWIAGMVVSALAGCAHLDAEPSPADTAEAAASAADPALADPVPDPLAEPLALLEAGRYSDALIACVDLGQRAPETPGLAALRDTILAASLQRRTEEALQSRETSEQYMALEALESSVVPDTFGLRRILPEVEFEPEPDGGSVMRVLDAPVSMHLRGADLPMLIDALSTDTNINIIADAGLGAGKTIDVEIDQVPLREVLDYIARNFGIRFYYGQSMIWATTAEAAANQPLQTRVFTLKKGLQYQGIDWGKQEPRSMQEGKQEPSPTQQSDIGQISNKATVLPTGVSYLETIITNFVPAVEGAQLHLDHHTHSLFVRNTPENLELIAEIIRRLDINPPQVLIEARFVEITVSDLRELGVEWVLDSPWIVSRTTLGEDGGTREATRSQVDQGDLVQFDPFTTDDEGPFPLGPQGAFGLNRLGNPPTAEQGLNLTYRGVLTEPMFQAVLHALEISGQGQLISVPRVTTLNNNPAKLRSGEDLLYFSEFEAQALQIVDEDNKRLTVSVLIPKGAPKLEELGVTLVAVPSVGADRRSISLLLTPTISRLEGFVSYQDESFEPIPGGSANVRQIVAKLPIFSRREIQTKLVVQSGETVVLGGLIDTIQQETIHRIPVLGSLPMVGRLFRRTDTTEENKNLLVFVTATVISERGESLLSPSTSARTPGAFP